MSSEGRALLKAHLQALHGGKKFLLTTRAGHTVLIDGKRNPDYNNNRETHNEFGIRELAEVLRGFRLEEVK